MTSWAKIRKEILKDKAVKKLYNDMDLEYRIISDLIALRNKRNLTQKQMAQRMKTSQSALSRFESGVIDNPSLNFLKKIAAALDAKLSVKFVS